MLNLTVKFLFRKSLKSCFCFGNIRNIKLHHLRNYASFTQRDILYESSDETGTLLTRFAKHIALERFKWSTLIPTRIHYSDYFPVIDMKSFKDSLQKTSTDQIGSIITFAFSYRPNSDPGIFANILNECDAVATRKLPEMDDNTIFRTLYAFLFLIPNWITRLDFYVAAMERLTYPNKDSSAVIKTKSDFVQLCFYLGLNKKNISSKRNIVDHLKITLNENLETFLDELSTLDLAIISNAAYKCSLRITSEKFNMRLIKDVLTTDLYANQDAIFITFLKSMRLQRIHSNSVIDYLTKICKNPNSLKTLQICGQVHLFVYLAENLWDSKECTEPLIAAFFENVKCITNSSGMQYSNNIRGKDISNFLWCCAQLNCPLTTQQYQTIENELWDRMYSDEWKRYPDQLIDACLSLWILGYRCKPLIQNAIQLKQQQKMNFEFKRPQPKVDNRLTVLLSAVQIEEPEWNLNLNQNESKAFDLDAKIPQHLLNSCDINFKELMQTWSLEDDICSIRIVCPINGVNIPCYYVVMSTENNLKITTFIELLPYTHILRFSGEPVGIYRLKIRLLRALNQHVLIMTTKHLSENRKLKDVILDTLENSETLEKFSA